MKKVFGILVLILSVVFFSCQRDNLFSDQVLSEKSAVIVQDEMAVENAEADVDFETNFYVNAEKSITIMARKGIHWNWKNILRYRMGQCPDVTIDSTETGYPKTIILNYGDGVELNNGRILSGVITIVVTAPPRTDGATKTVTYDNFSVDSISVSGATQFVFTGDDLTSRTHKQTGSLVFTLPDGKTISREINRTVEWLAGIDTPEDMTDDMIKYTGSVEVTTSDGNQYSKVITDPLIKIGDCRWFVQGTIEISINGETTLIIDYGDGECDVRATVTKNGVTSEIDLKGRGPKVNRGK